MKTTQFKVGQRVWYVRLDTFKKSDEPRAELKELIVYKVIPNYLETLGLHYACRKVGKDQSWGMSYRPERLYATREEAVMALNERISNLIDRLKALYVS